MSSRDPAACHAAIHGLLHAIPEEQRAHAAVFLLDELARLYAAAGRPLPDGLRVLREHGGTLPDGARVHEQGRRTAPMAGRRLPDGAAGEGR